MSSASNFPVSYFGLFTLPNLVAPDKHLAEVMHEVHEQLFNILAAFALCDRERRRDMALRTGMDPLTGLSGYASWALWTLGYPQQALERELCIATFLRETH